MLQSMGSQRVGHDGATSLSLGKIEGGRRRGRQRMRWLDGITDSMDMMFERALGVGDGQGSVACCSPWGGRVGHD